MRMQKIDLNNGSLLSNITTATDFIERFCSKLDFSSKEINMAMIVASNAKKLGIVEENTPPSIASGCIYYVCEKVKNGCTKTDISKVCNISEVTIGKCYKKLKQHNLMTI